MAVVKVIDAVKPYDRKRRIGVYARVSTDSADQQNSYASQIKHYTALIEKHPEWELIDVYADHGLTGTKLDHRDEFLRMMRDARQGKLDEVLVKSISRFARNTKDCLASLRELIQLGVTVRFDKDNLDTETLTSELMVSVSASLAQQESISMSQNMRWSYQKRMQSGKFITCNAPFGYRLVNGKELVIHEAEAEIVKWIFESYLDGMSMTEIAAVITASEYLTGEGNPVWTKSAISYILQNEKYIGDSIGQKNFTTDTLPFIDIQNKGQKPQYYAMGTHPAIIDKDTFERVQALIKSRRPKSADTPREQHLLARKIICGSCGTIFMRRVTKKGLIMWVCREHDANKSNCPVGRIPESEIFAAFMRMLAKLKANYSIILTPVISQLQELSEAENKHNGTMLAITKEIAVLQEQSLTVNKLRERGLIPLDNYLDKNAKITARLSELKKQRRILLEANDGGQNTLRQLRELLRIIKKTDVNDAFDENVFSEIVEKVIVDSQENIRFQLMGGLILSEQIRGKIR